MANRYYPELDCYRRILDIIYNSYSDSQKLNAIKHLIYNQFEHYPCIQNPPSETTFGYEDNFANHRYSKELKFEVDIPDFVKKFRDSTLDYLFNERSNN